MTLEGQTATLSSAGDFGGSDDEVAVCDLGGPDDELLRVCDLHVVYEI